MARFNYQAKKGPQEVVQGVLIADNRAAAIRMIGQMGYYLIGLEEEGPAGATNPSARAFFFDRISLKDITDLTRQLSDLLESGLTIVKAMDILCQQTPNKKLKRVLTDLRDHCTAGNPLSAALARHPGLFSDLYIKMIRSGETGGALENILKRLSDFSEKQLEMRTKIRTAMAYPALMSVVGLATVLVLMVYVIPKMMVMFDDMGQALPWPTQMLLWVSQWLRDFGWVLVVAGFAGSGLLIKAYRTPEGRLSMDRLKLRAPLFGPLALKVEIARSARTLATLLENGVPMLESLRVTSATVGNASIRQEMEKAYEAVREGSSLANGFYGSRVIPPAMLNMIAIGEESGRLERSLHKVAQTYDRESDEQIKIMMSLLEPVLILVLGALVGFIVIAMLLPIFEINFMMK